MRCESCSPLREKSLPNTPFACRAEKARMKQLMLSPTGRIRHVFMRKSREHTVFLGAEFSLEANAEREINALAARADRQP
jgi:hypothetical protein